MSLAAIVLAWASTGGWAPPFRYRSGHIPPRDIVARASFSVVNEGQIEQQYEPPTTLAQAGRPLSTDDVEDVLRAEYAAVKSQLTFGQMLRHSLATIAVYVGLYVLCGCYVYYHHRRIVQDIRQLTMLLGAVVAAIALSVVVGQDAWRAESVPLVLFGMTVAIAYDRELALLLSVALALVIAVALGQGLDEFVILGASAATPILMLNRVRSRTKLIYVGLGGGLITFATAVVVGTMAGQAFGLSSTTDMFTLRLLSGAAWIGGCVVLAGFLMTGLLPFVEQFFDVQTDISLLELGDAAHPLLQELAHRAPGTYNHSINVASIAENAAEAIGANGLLVRVGAYFHDIGKMLKPAYFVENQQENASQHASLLPAMSTLVIIAHVKDGADLGRQHRLPKSIIDFVEQHHGTTLVEYFYRQAERKREENPDSGDVDETTYRYPGPKPRTKESAVLMLADAVESASRTLVEPTPARIEALVHEISMKRLLDEQFEECSLTLRELNTIEDSLVKSLAAVYHGRIKYPDQQTA
jgi:putative nucleotidyltransferase with HDIG domain